jgi:hypothetical protein
LFAAMKAEAVELGEKLIVQESELDRQFAERTVDPDSLRGALDEIATTKAQLRYAHLKHHLLAVAVVTPAQRARYMELRGYAQAGEGGHHRGHR